MKQFISGPLRDGISNVEYIDHMGNDLSVVNAARVSFDKRSEWETKPSLVDVTGFERALSQADAKLINYLASHNHWTPFGHAQLSLRVKAPIFVARQLVKHQVGLVWNEVSRRYIDTPPDFYWPEELNARAENIKQGSTGTGHPLSRAFEEQYRHKIYELASLYSRMIAAGVAPEEARMFLPLNMYTEWVWSGSLTAWMRIINLRCDPHSQSQTRAYGQAFAHHVEGLFPVSFAALNKPSEQP